MASYQEKGVTKIGIGFSSNSLEQPGQPGQSQLDTRNQLPTYSNTCQPKRPQTSEQHMTTYTRREQQRTYLSQKARLALAMFEKGVTATQAAKALGISRMTLYRGLKALPPDATPAVETSYQGRILPAAANPPALESDPLLDGWYESVSPVTDPDDNDLLA